jgi:hypothetical protein
MYINSGGRPGNLAHLHLYGFDVYKFPTTIVAGAPNTPAPVRIFSVDGEHDSHGMAATRDGSHIWVFDRHANNAEIISTATSAHVNTVRLSGSIATDPAPDLVDISPNGNLLFVAFRGATPLSGDPHIATGNAPGMGIIEVEGNGSRGQLVGAVRISNVDTSGVDRADAHAVRVRLK